MKSDAETFSSVCAELRAEFEQLVNRLESTHRREIERLEKRIATQRQELTRKQHLMEGGASIGKIRLENEKLRKELYELTKTIKGENNNGIA